LERVDPKHERDEIVEILEERIARRTIRQRTKKYLVNWGGKGLEEATWISKEELEWIT
jgi:hypothetical protein